MSYQLQHYNVLSIHSDLINLYVSDYVTLVIDYYWRVINIVLCKFTNYISHFRCLFSMYPGILIDHLN